ncbi:MAG: hypothetical protein U1F76_31335 [Candidatus Competibacteraceae bacterium]
MTTPLRQPVECIVTVNGKEIVPFYRYLREVRVEMSRHAATVGTLMFDSLRREDGSWLVQDAGIFLPWRRLRIDACFGNRREEVMRGFIKEVRAECPEDMSAAVVTITGQDESLMLDREHRRGNLSTARSPLTDGQLAQRIATDHGLLAQVEPGITHTSLNIDSTPIKFLQDRAEANGFELLVRAGTLYFRSPQLGGTPQPVILVYAGTATNCLRFTVSFDGHKPDRVQVIRAAERGTGTDAQTVAPNLPLLGKTPVTSSGAGLKPFTWTLSRPGGATVAEVRTRAQSQANENAWKLKAEGEIDGALYGHVLLTHQTVEVDGVGSTYGGLYYVDEVQHVFSIDGYR